MSCTNSESVTELKPNVKRIEDKGDCIPVQSQVIQDTYEDKNSLEKFHQSLNYEELRDEIKPSLCCIQKFYGKRFRLAVGIPLVLAIIATGVVGSQGYNLFSQWSDFWARSRAAPPKRAVVRILPGSDENVSGTLSLTTVSHPHKAVLVQGSIHGLKPGLHGFHVHMNGELTTQCKDAGGHFNPSGASHASPRDSERHAGDLGNILTPPHGYTTYVSLIDGIISLGDGGPADVAGRAFVVHAGEDDLGRGGDDESKKTGNAGDRLACGVIQLLN